MEKKISKKKNKKPPPENNNYLPKKVALIYSDVKREYFPTDDQYITEKDAFKEASVIAKYLNRLKIKTFLFPGTPTLPFKLRREKPDMVINLVASVKGNEYLASTIPAMLEFLEIPYTGSGILGESLSYNKFLVRKLMQQNGIPVPNCQLFYNHVDPLDYNLRFPLISKLNEIHGAVEITKDSISENEKHLRLRLKYLIETYNQPVMVEEFIVGQEITALLFEGFNKKVYLGEKIIKKNTGKYRFASFELQWLDTDENIAYRKFEDLLLREYVKKAFEVAEMFDYGKFDIRLDQSGRYFFVDANSNPAFGSKELECAIASILDLYEVTFIEILKRLIENTMRDAMGKKLLPITKNGNNS